MSRVRVFIATSLDGFIAGADDDLSWLPPHGAGAEDTYTPFIAGIGAVLMGRRSYDVVRGLPGPWPYPAPVLVASHRELVEGRPDVTAVKGSIGEMVQRAREVAGPKDVYLDGGALIRSALDADLIDVVTVTIVPVVLGEGVPLFARSSSWGAAVGDQIRRRVHRPLRHRARGSAAAATRVAAPTGERVVAREREKSRGERIWRTVIRNCGRSREIGSDHRQMGPLAQAT